MPDTPEFNITFGPGPDDVTVDGIDNGIKNTAQLAEALAYVNAARANNFRATLIADGRGADGSLIRILEAVGEKVVHRDLIDLHGAFGATGFGNGNDTLAELVIDQILRGTPMVPATIGHRLLLSTLRTIRKLTGMKDGVSFFASDGNLALDAAIRIALNHQCRRRGITLDGKDDWSGLLVVAADGCYHGSAGFPRAFLSNPKARANFGPLPGNVVNVPYGDIPALEALFASGKVAVLVLEPVQGAGGCVAPPEGYLAAARSLCREHDVVFILDEVKSCLGRLGEYFVAQARGLEPDLLCGGKAAGGGIVPFSFVVGRPDIMRGFEPGTFGLTTVSTPLQCKAFLAAVKELSDRIEGTTMLEDIRRKARLLEGVFGRLRSKYPEHVVMLDGGGLMRSLETTLPGPQLVLELRKRGVHTSVVERNPKRVYVTPVLTISDAQIGMLAEAFEGSIEALS